MTSNPLPIQLERVDEPEQGQDFSAVLSRVASDHRPVIVRRQGKEIVAVVPLDYLEDLLTRTPNSGGGSPAVRAAWSRFLKRVRRSIRQQQEEEKAELHKHWKQFLRLVRETTAYEEAEKLGGSLDFDRLAKANPPPQTWFEGDEPKPF